MNTGLMVTRIGEVLQIPSMQDPAKKEEPTLNSFFR